MSVQAEIDRLKGTIAGAYDAVGQMGGTLPEERVSGNLAEAIRSIPAGVIFLESIAVTKPPAKTSYVSGDAFDPAGMEVTATYTHGMSRKVTGWTCSSEALSTSTDHVTIRFTEGGVTAEASQAVTVLPVYGVSWDGSSTTKLTRTDDAAGFAAPVAAVGTGAGSSPFDNIMPWSGMTRVTQDGNALVAIPKYWVKVQSDPFRVQIANAPGEGFQVSPAHRDRGDGKGERNVVYIGRYECDTSYMSRSGQVQKVSAYLATARSGIHALGSTYWQADYALQLTWWYLYLVEYANWDGQAVIGRGIVDFGVYEYAVNTGATDSMTYHTGRAAGTDGMTAIQYRNIENPWGNVRELRDGIIFSDANISTYNNPANFSDSYNGTGATVRSNKRPTAMNGYIKAWGHDANDPSFIYPSELGGSETTFVPDICYYDSGVVTLIVGNYWAGEASAGPFHLFGFYEPTTTYRDIGTRLQKLP